MVKTKGKKTKQTPAGKIVAGVKKKKDKRPKKEKKKLLEALRKAVGNDEAAMTGGEENKTENGDSEANHQNEGRSDLTGVDDLEKLLYKPLPKKDHKVKLDPRFQEIFTNPEYAGVTRDTDERGARKLLKQSGKKGQSKKKTQAVEESEEESAESEPEVDSEDEETDLEEEFRRASEDEEPVWEKLEEPRVEFLEEATRRLCLKHMQWDKVTARDIYVLVRSFLPAEGTLRRVTIYPSEEGVAKIPHDERAGPAIIGDLDSLAEKEGVTEWPGEGKTTVEAPEELEVALSEPKAKRLNMCRRYEIDRLAFYYAILDFDSPETANAVYEAIDGTEYESSGCRIDLYFVEDSRQVDRHLCGRQDESMWRAMISSWPEAAAESAEADLDRYAPPNFVNNALRHTHQFGLSWDETPAERKEWLEALAGVDDFDDAWQENCPELSHYLAMTDSSESEEEEAAEKERKRQLIRGLLAEADAEEKKKKRRQMRGLKKADISDSDDEEEEEKVVEKEMDDGDSSEEASAADDEKMETSGEEAEKEEDNFFKKVAKKRKEEVQRKRKKGKDPSQEATAVAPPVERPKERKERETDGVKEKDGRRKRKRLSKKQMAKAKLKAKEQPSDPELALLLSSFKRTTKTPKHVDSKEVAEDPRFASIFKDPKFAKDTGSLVRLSARL